MFCKICSAAKKDNVFAKTGAGKRNVCEGAGVTRNSEYVLNSLFLFHACITGGSRSYYMSAQVNYTASCKHNGGSY